MDKTLLNLIKHSTNTLDLSSIPLDELKKQYVEYAITHNPVTFHDKLIKTQRIQESAQTVTYSEPLPVVREELMKKYDLQNWQFKIKEMYNNISVAIVIPHVGYNIDMIIKDMYTLGYHYSISEKIQKYTAFGMQYIAITFEPLFTVNIADKVRKMKRLRHLTPKFNELSIYNNGFIANHQNKKYSYPNRVYFITDEASDEIVLDLYQMLSNISGENNYSLITIDPQQLDMSVHFYADPMYKFGVFTYDNISKDVIVSFQDIIPDI